MLLNWSFDMFCEKLILTVIAVAAINTAHGATIDFTSASAFAAATSNPITIGFNGILPAGTSFLPFNPLNLVGISFSATGPGVVVNLTTATFYSPNNYPSDFIVDSANTGVNNTLLISFPAPVFALALDYGGLGFTGTGSGTFTLSNGHVFTQPVLPTVGNTAFLGFVSTDPITSLQFVANDDSWVVTGLITASPVPEPSSGRTLGAGILLAVLAGRFLSSRARIA
jgi:hypothetical protein